MHHQCASIAPSTKGTYGTAVTHSCIQPCAAINRFFPFVPCTTCFQSLAWGWTKAKSTHSAVFDKSNVQLPHFSHTSFAVLFAIPNRQFIFNLANSQFSKAPSPYADVFLFCPVDMVAKFIAQSLWIMTNATYTVQYALFRYSGKQCCRTITRVLPGVRVVINGNLFLSQTIWQAA